MKTKYVTQKDREHNKRVIKALCETFITKEENIMSKSRNRYKSVYPRFFGWLFGEMTYGNTGVKLASLYPRDHSTVICGIKKIVGYISTGDLEMIEFYNKMKTYFPEITDFDERLNKIKERIKRNEYQTNFKKLHYGKN